MQSRSINGLLLVLAALIAGGASVGYFWKSKQSEAADIERQRLAREERDLSRRLREAVRDKRQFESEASSAKSSGRPVPFVPVAADEDEAVNGKLDELRKVLGQRAEELATSRRIRSELEQQNEAQRLELKKLTSRREPKATIPKPSQPALTSDSITTALRAVLVEYANGLDRQIPTKVGTMPSLLPSVEALVRDPEVSARALDFAGQMPSFDLDRCLTVLACGIPRSEETRTAAGRLVRKLARRGRDDGLDVLAGHDSANVRWAVLGATLINRTKLDEKRARRLIGMLGDSDAEIAKGASAALLKEALSPPAFGHILRRVAGGETSHRTTLLRALMRTDLSGALPALTEAALADPEKERELFDLLRDGPRKDAFERPEVAAEVMPFLRASSAGLSKQWAKGVLSAFPGLRSSQDPDDVFKALINRRQFESHLSRSLFSPRLTDSIESQRRLGRLGAQSAVKVVESIRDETTWEGASDRLRLKALAELVRHPSPRVSVYALQELASSSSHLVAPILSSKIKRSEPDLRMTIAVALARLGHKDGLSNLASWMKGDRAGRVGIVERLVDVGTDESLSIAEGVIDLGDAEATQRLVELFRQMKRPLGLARIETLLTKPLLGSPVSQSFYSYLDESVGREARKLAFDILLENRAVDIPSTVRYVGLPPDAQLKPFLLRYLEHEDATVRAGVLEVLEQYKDAELADNLALLINDPAPLVRTKLASCLQPLHEPVARGCLIALSKDDDRSVREAAVVALGAAPFSRVVPALKERLRDDVKEVRNAALMSLCRIGNFEHLPDLFAELDDASMRSRTQAFLKEHFKKDLVGVGQWNEWWDLEGHLTFRKKE